MMGRPVLEPRTRCDIRPTPLLFRIQQRYRLAMVFLNQKRCPSTEEGAMVRIAPLNPPYEPEVADQLARMMPPGVPAIGLFRMFARNLPLARGMSGWAGYYLTRQLRLSVRQRELVIDRTCARTGCEYEWGVHVRFYAERVGLSRAQVTSLVHGQPADACWTDPAERLLLTAVDALHDGNDLDDPLWTELVATFTEEQLLDAMLLAGWYHAISYAARASRLPLEPGAPTFADYAA
jgi:alkylhydroperoxidase family enzyme